MPTLDPHAIEQQAEAAIEEVERCYRAAWLEAWFFSEDAQGQLENVLRPAINEWESTRREWAAEGRRPDGGAFSWEQWFSAGSEYASSCAELAQASWDQSIFKVVIGTATDTTKDVGDLASKAAPWNWPTWVTVLAVLAVLAYAANAVTSWRRA